MNKILKNCSISFIMPAYNCEDTIAESVESIFKGNFSDGDEVIIIDDASTDNTFNVIQNLKKKYPYVRVLQHHYNKGSAAAGRNTGIDNSKNDLIFCLDADNVLCPYSVPKLKKFMLAKGADAAAFGELHYFRKSIQNVTHKWIYKQESTLYDVINNTKKVPCASGNYLFTKESWIKAGRYNESSSIIAYDSFAFGFYQLATGSKMVTMPNSFYYHRYGYDSTFIREVKKINPSLTILQIILPYLHLFNEKDIKYFFSYKNIYKWYDNVDIRPIRVKQQQNTVRSSKIILRRIKKSIKKINFFNIYNLLRKIYGK